MIPVEEHPNATIVDLFSGPRGWSEGLRALGLRDIGLEIDAAACATAIAAGHLTVRADVEQYPAARFRGAEGLIASPPCQDFSLAGNRAGRDGARGRLIDLVPEWVDVIRPEWIACEQVPPCLAIWREHAELYREVGYSTWVGILNAANYGVPQTRKRAILMAHRSRPVSPPEPTHAKDPGDSLFAQRLPWVSMAEALGWDGFEARYQRGAGMVERHGPRPARPDSEPAPTLTGSALGAGAGAKMSFVRTGSVQSGEPGTRHEQPLKIPGPIVTSRADLWTLHTNRAEGSIKISVQDALILQSFRPDYPLQGSKTKQFEQVGNAIPPVLAQAILGELVRA